MSGQIRISPEQMHSRATEVRNEGENMFFSDNERKTMITKLENGEFDQYK